MFTPRIQNSGTGTCAMKQPVLERGCVGEPHGRYPGTPVFDDFVKRQFRSDAPNKVWLTDITEHWTNTGNLYACAIKDVYSKGLLLRYSEASPTKPKGPGSLISQGTGALRKRGDGGI